MLSGRSTSQPRQIIMTNTKFQRDGLVQSLSRSSFPSPSAIHSMLPADQGTDDSQIHAPQPNALSKAKGKEASCLISPKSLSTVVKLSGSTCCRAMVIQDACGFSGRRHRRDSQRSRAKPNFAQRRSSDVKRSHGPM